MEFEDAELEGVLEVECHPSPRRFDRPLLFDFLVDGENTDDPIMDEYGRIRFEVTSRQWTRDVGDVYELLSQYIPQEAVQYLWGPPIDRVPSITQLNTKMW